MQIIRDTEFEVGYTQCQIKRGRDALSIAIKGTFSLHATRCEIAGEQATISGDRFIDEDFERAVYYPSDLALIKPHAECFLIGTCHPAGGRASKTAVSFRVGAVQRSFVVFGNRYWKPGVLRGATEPEPFDSLPLTSEGSFGGATHDANPFGRGIHALPGSDGRVPLPNIEDPQQLIQSRTDRPAPALAFPEHPGSPRRTRALGSYDAAWVKTHWPWFPDDLDPSFFNAAPAEQQIEGFWRGDEEIVVQNLLPGEPKLSTRLPGIRARCFVEMDSFHEVPLRLDTITLNTDTREVYCVWRGLLDLPSDRLDVVHTMFVAHQVPGPSLKPEHYRARLAEKRREEAGEVSDHAAVPPPAFSAPIAAVAASPFAAIPSRLAAHGLSVPADDPTATTGNVAEETSFDFERLMRDRGTARERQVRDDVIERIRTGETLSGIDLSGGDLSGFDFSGRDLSLTHLDKARLANTNFSGCNLGGAQFTKAQIDGANFRGAKLPMADLTGVSGQAVNFDDALLDGATVCEATLPRASFRNASCSGTDFGASQMQGADFRDAMLEHADLSHATLDAADFTRARLAAADFSGAHARAARLVECDLTRLRATDGANFDGASMMYSRASHSVWTDAHLERANFSFAVLERADFSNGWLAGAAFTSCNLKCARFNGAHLKGAEIVKADAFEAIFESADLSDADLRGSNLHGAAFWRARTRGAQLELAVLTGTLLQRS